MRGAEAGVRGGTDCCRVAREAGQPRSCPSAHTLLLVLVVYTLVCLPCCLPLWLSYAAWCPGTWSDGKLTTRIGRNSDPVRRVLDTLYRFGAPEVQPLLPGRHSLQAGGRQ